MEVMDNSVAGTNELRDRSSQGAVREPMKKNHPETPERSAGDSGFFISPLRPSRSREDLERAWKDTE
jgi:hypothetical protein